MATAAAVTVAEAREAVARVAERAADMVAVQMAVETAVVAKTAAVAKAG